MHREQSLVFLLSYHLSFSSVQAYIAYSIKDNVLMLCTVTANSCSAYAVVLVLLWLSLYVVVVANKSIQHYASLAVVVAIAVATVVIVVILKARIVTRSCLRSKASTLFLPVSVSYTRCRSMFFLLSLAR